MSNNDNQTLEKAKREEEMKKVITAIYHRTAELLKLEFPEYKIAGQIRHHNIFGPFFPFELSDEQNKLVYACGFMFNELLHKHKDVDQARRWLASFYVDMIDEGVSRPLPASPSSAEEGGQIIRDIILPQCIKTIREEFGEYAVHVKFSTHPQLGPVLEAAYPEIKQGNNICAVPVNLLLALHLLNRDYTETIINGIYKLREDAGIE